MLNARKVDLNVKMEQPRAYHYGGDVIMKMTVKMHLMNLNAVCF